MDTQLVSQTPQTNTQAAVSSTLTLSFIIVTYKRGDFLERCLQAIYEQKGLPRPFEIVIVDNAGDADVAQPDDPDIHLHVEQSGENLWVSGGRNRGIELARGEYLVFVDDDALWHSDHDVAQLLSHFDTDPQCGAVAVLSLLPSGDVSIGEIPHPDKLHLLSKRNPFETPYFYGYGHAIRAAALRDVGTYPHRFRYQAEEFDLCYRIIKAGYHIVFEPRAAVYHHKAQAGRSYNAAHTWRDMAINKVQVAFRTLPWPYPWTTLLIWSGGVLRHTRNPRMVWQMWRRIWAARHLLRAERDPLSQERVKYIRAIGGRVLY